jgi:soluble cytochrome b562
VNVELDLSRLDQVVEVLGSSMPEIVAGILTSLTEAIDGLNAHLDDGELELAAKAAHACRNDALLVGARPLLSVLNELEQAARHGRLEQARSATLELGDVWPPTQEALAEIARAAG